ncbi:MAG: outer membrane lipoprotein-sorting protein [Bacteroidales bacterium]|jgi:outer membrane lipoprotein-sorting protein|nr:outer membrane lipoprotein-sorting protein [Bacteroidales bacterium]
MKKLFLALTCLLAVSVVGAQSLDDIVKKYTAANKLDKVKNLKTIKITGNMSMMGMEMPVEVWMKNPDKVKSVVNFNGQLMVQAFDGTKGYTINPMTGGTEPVEMSSQDVKSIQRNNMFSNYLETYLKNGQLALAGEESVNGSPAHKIKATVEPGMVIDLFIDKSSSLLVKTSVTMNAEGQTVVADSYPTDYKDINGLFLPMKTTTSVMGQELVQTYTNVEVDIPMDDSVFQLKK